jgi:hypothetical protein
LRVPAILFAALLLGSSADDDSIVLSVSAKPSAVPLSESVTLVSSLRNRSDEPRYVYRDVGRQLDFAVRGADGRLVRGFMHPPAVPPIPSDSRDWVRIEGKKPFGASSECPWLTSPSNERRVLADRVLVWHVGEGAEAWL